MALPRTKGYAWRPKDSVPRLINLDVWSDQMLMAISNGRYSATIRLLVAQEYGRRVALGQIKPETVSGVLPDES